MGIWDNVKGRFGIGGSGSNNQGRDAEYYDSADYDEAYQDDYDEGYEDEYDRPASMRSYGVDRADYYNDNHAPLVSQTDVRSQPIPVSVANGQVRDRIPVLQPTPRNATSSTLMDLQQQEDAMAFKGGLARSSNSLAELQVQRLKMEDTGRIPPIDLGATASSSAQLDTQGEVIDASARFAQGQVRQRVHRRVEQIRPVTYADAEQVSLELKKGVIVALDLRSARPDLAKRILDFSFGVASALDGQVERYVDRVYVFSRNGPLTEIEQATIRL